MLSYAHYLVCSVQSTAISCNYWMSSEAKYTVHNNITKAVQRYKLNTEITGVLTKFISYFHSSCSHRISITPTGNNIISFGVSVVILI